MLKIHEVSSCGFPGCFRLEISQCPPEKLLWVIYQMWVRGAGLGQAEIRRNSDLREVLLIQSSPWEQLWATLVQL